MTPPHFYPACIARVCYQVLTDAAAGTELEDEGFSPRPNLYFPAPISDALRAAVMRVFLNDRACRRFLTMAAHDTMVRHNLGWRELRSQLWMSTDDITLPTCNRVVAWDPMKSGVIPYFTFICDKLARNMVRDSTARGRITSWPLQRSETGEVREREFADSYAQSALTFIAETKPGDQFADKILFARPLRFAIGQARVAA